MPDTNPYANHPQLSPLEADVLWEYAKLASTIKKITELARDTAENPNVPLLEDLRELEKKMKLVFTNYQGAVYRITQDYYAAEEAAYGDDNDVTLNANTNANASASAYDRTQFGYNRTMEGDSTIRY